ncbi:molybdopterin converting factor small subunit [Neoasaia chiangmaiensis NBRC 101099]|uniref:Molybdopterin synthase sulfur carrier subunit n=1 Tax=Neoasaia chiangmaiensis TaxID=320497 RepID=A0A1U9KSG0_9PROT|nr:MoaD/ThiS family protein [Neoasaia chiangmaiensis]AQS88649.1 molybdopterin synthase sulfur carrier subunit [Neoasaia chiangmaiensis]GBR41161.1 molybdopterin converting factor small subunit [Neoasaia chiangmaiensis NBRC 101099]GEN13587.1 molybdopterin synthase sulfur carrier subunit [Neoasaia chiangmaiensis]
MPRIELEYFAQMREQAGCHRETRDTQALSAAALYDELRDIHRFTLEPRKMRVAINAAFRPWDQVLADGDTVVFIPPVTGG